MGNGLYMLANVGPVLANAIAADGLSIRDWILTAIGIGQGWLVWKQRRIDRLEIRVEKKAEQLVKARIDAIAGGLKTSVESLHNSMIQINRRLERGDERFRDIDTGDRKSELQHVRELHDLSDFVRDNCASKEDMQALSQRFDGLQQAVARALVDRNEERGNASQGKVRT